MSRFDLVGKLFHAGNIAQGVAGELSKAATKLANQKVPPLTSDLEALDDQIGALYDAIQAATDARRELNR